MPRQRPETEARKAKALTKAYVRNGFNAAATARELGVKRASVNTRLHREPVKKVMAQLLDEAGVTDQLLATKILEGLDATKLTYVENGDAIGENGEPKRTEETVSDFIARHKYLVTALELKKHTSPESPLSVNVIQVYVPKQTREDEYTNTINAADLEAPQRPTGAVPSEPGV